VFFFLCRIGHTFYVLSLAPGGHSHVDPTQLRDNSGKKPKARSNFFRLPILLSKGPLFDFMLFGNIFCVTSCWPGLGRALGFRSRILRQVLLLHHNDFPFVSPFRYGSDTALCLCRGIRLLPPALLFLRGIVSVLFFCRTNS